MNNEQLLIQKWRSLSIDRGYECVITAQVLIEFWVVATRPIEVNGLGWSVEKTRAKINRLIIN
jgi:hypothetical protein